MAVVLPPPHHLSTIRMTALALSRHRVTLSLSRYPIVPLLDFAVATRMGAILIGHSSQLLPFVKVILGPKS